MHCYWEEYLEQDVGNHVYRAGISGRKTNHSLRAYAATELFQAGIPEKVIQDRSGHCTLEGLRKYERISDQQRQEACKALTTDKIILSAANKTMSKDDPVHVSSFNGQENLPPSGEVMLAGCAKSNPPAPLQNQHPSLQVMTNSLYYQMQQQMPSFSFGSARSKIKERRGKILDTHKLASERHDSI